MCRKDQHTIVRLECDDDDVMVCVVVVVMMIITTPGPGSLKTLMNQLFYLQLEPVFSGKHGMFGMKTFELTKCHCETCESVAKNYIVPPTSLYVSVHLFVQQKIHFEYITIVHICCQSSLIQKSIEIRSRSFVPSSRAAGSAQSHGLPACCSALKSASCTCFSPRRQRLPLFQLHFSAQVI